MVELKTLSLDDIEEIKNFFSNVFTKEPWNDDWSDKTQLHRYIADLTGNSNSLTFGLYKNEEMTGLCIGSIRHWFSGTIYFIDEFCIKTEEQGNGLGTYFIKLVEEYVKAKGVKQLFLQTERGIPAYFFYQKNGFTELENHITFVKDIF